MKKILTTALAPIIALTFGSIVVAAEPAAEKKAEPAKQAATTRRIDINTATEAQLKAILGVGDEDARNIIAARPYYKKDELKTRNVIPADSFERIKRLIDAVC